MSTSTHRSRAHRRRTPAERHLQLAWIFVVLTPFAFVGAMFLGEGLLTGAGYSGEETVPLDVALRAGGSALLLMLAPTLGAVWYGLRARREGLRNGFVPAVVGGTIAAAALVTNVGSYVLGRLVG
jgi:hypothetical protein